jgi:hypothetical protein
MAKQYLFFKLCSEPVNYVPADQLFEKELFVFFQSLHRIETVFELNHFQEIRQLFEKDVHLQRHITHALPDSGIHGYLAIVESPPPTEKLVKRLALCDEFIVFQRSHELKDTYIRYLAGKNISKQLQVYNWHIFIIPTLRSFNCSIPTAMQNNINLEKIDKIFQKPEKIFCRSFQSHPDPMHEIPGILDPIDEHASRLFAAITNILIQDSTYFTDLSATSSHLLRHASITGIPISGYTRTNLQTIENRMRTQFFILDISVVQAAVIKFTSLLGQLLDEPKYRQSHLFHSDIDLAFKLFESKILLKHNDIKSYKRHLKLFRNIIAARFLIDHEYITHDESINLFLSFNLLQAIYNTLQNRTKIPFTIHIEKNADKLIAEMYICQKTHELFGIKPAFSNIVQGEINGRQGSRQKQAFFIRLPEHSSNQKSKDRNHINFAMNLYQPGFNNYHLPNLSDDTRNDYILKIKTNRYLRDKLDFYRTFLSREEYLLLTDQCLHLLYSMDLILKTIKPGDCIGILAPIKYHYVEDSPHEFSFPEIILEYLDSLESFNHKIEYRLRIDTGNPNLKQEISIISSN